MSDFLNKADMKAILEAKKRLQNTLSLFRPMPHQEKFIRELSMQSVMETWLSGGNRSSKSTITAVWMASLLLDEPIIFESGEEFYTRPAHWHGIALLVWGIGYDWKHIGETLFRLLFRAGAFDIIRDDVTGKWRSYHPEKDKHRKLEKKPAPPLIPHSAIDPDSWDWENKKARQLHSVMFKKDSSRLVFYPSTAEVAQGNPVHAIWVDENIENQGHYAEWLMRISDFEGKIVWTSYPGTCEISHTMLGIKDRAESQRGSAEPTALYYEFKGSDNPYTQTKHRQAALATMSEEERAARDDGRVFMDSWLMYPRFNRGIHSVFRQGIPNDKLATAIKEEFLRDPTHYGIPQHWTKYMILDPGTANPAVLCAAVPPPWEFGDYVIPYLEVYPGRCDADKLAEKVRLAIGLHQFETFIADYRAAGRVAMGLGFSIGDNYSRAWRENRLFSHTTGSGFLPGVDIPEIRSGMLQEWLNVRPDGTPKLRILNNADGTMRLPFLCKQLEAFRRQASPDKKPTDKPAKYQTVDVAVCLEYLAGHVPKFVPRKEEKQMDKGFQAWQTFVDQNRGASKGQTVNCGPGQYSF